MLFSCDLYWLQSTLHIVNISRFDMLQENGWIELMWCLIKVTNIICLTHLALVPQLHQYVFISHIMLQYIYDMYWSWVIVAVTIIVHIW